MIHLPKEISRLQWRSAQFCSYLATFRGYLIYTIVRSGCTVRRSILALPLGVLLEPHGWWHILTGMGIYFYIVSLEHLRVITLNVSCNYQFIWRWKVFPELIWKGRKPSTRYSLELFGPYVEDQSIEVKKEK